MEELNLETVETSQVDLEEIRRSRLERNREEFDRDIAVSLLPEECDKSPHSLSEDAAALRVQKYFRGYVGRKRYREKLLEQFEKDERERQTRQRQQTEEAEILVETVRLQLEAQEDTIIHRNKLRMHNVYATRIQRAWRSYVAKKHTDSEVLMEDSLKGETADKVVTMMEGNSDDANSMIDQHIIDVASVDPATVNDEATGDKEDMTSMEEEEGAGVLAGHSLSTGDDSALKIVKKVVRFDLSVNGQELVSMAPSVEGYTMTSPVDGHNSHMGSHDPYVVVESALPEEKVKQLGYTQLRELRCVLETRLGVLSDALVSELQQREFLIGRKGSLLEKIQTMSKLVQSQYKPHKIKL